MTGLELVNFVLACLSGMAYWVVLDRRVSYPRGVIALVCAMLTAFFVVRAFP